MEKERLAGRSHDEFDYYLSGKAERTQIIYRRGLLKFLEHYDTNTEALYNQFIQDLKSQDRRDRARVGKMVTRLMVELQKQGYSGSYVSEIKKGINAFFKANAEDVIYTRGKSVIDKSTNGKDRMTREHLLTLLDATGSMRNKSIITMGKDTGLRVSDLANIRVGHVIDAIRDERGFHTFEMGVEKTTGETGVKANPVFGPDAMKYLKLWWKERERYGCGEDPDDYLYCTVEDKPEHMRGGKLISGQSKGDSLNPHAISVMVYRLIRKAGLGDENISAHSMRKFHETELGRKVKDTWIDKMTGRAEGYKGVYIKPDADDLIAEYRTGYNEISLEPRTEINELEVRKIMTIEEIETWPISEEDKATMIETVRRCLSIDGLRQTKDTLRMGRTGEKEVLLVSEDELPNHLSHGWDYVGATPNGKCIIRRTK